MWTETTPVSEWEDVTKMWTETTPVSEWEDAKAPRRKTGQKNLKPNRLFLFCLI